MRTWVIACSVLLLIVAALLRIEYRLAHPTVPPGVQRSECLTPPPQRGEAGKDWLTRLGGRVTRYPNARWQDGYTAAGIAQGRDLSGYEKLALRDPEPHHYWQFRRNPTLAQARTFVWKHWQERKRGYLILTITGVDHTSTAHVFVESDDSGRWRIYRRQLDRWELVDEPTVYSMLWVKPDGSEKPGTALSAGEAPDPLTDELELRDVCGERIGQL